MAALKTLPNDASVTDFLNTVDDETKRTDGLALLKLFKKVTKKEPQMWGTSMVGFGMYHYKSERSTQEGDWPLTAFSPRKQALTVYIMSGFAKYTDLLEKLGKYKTSNGGCLYIKRLSDVDVTILEQIIERSFNEMKKLYNTK